MRRRPLAWRIPASVIFAVCLSGCGGESGNSINSQSSGTAPPPTPQALVITTSAVPNTLTNAQYSATLQSANGIGALTWSIAAVSPTALFVEGLSIDPKTGVLSGTAKFSGTAGFVATVIDSASPPRIAKKNFAITASSPLQAPLAQTTKFAQYQSNYATPFTPVGGVWPFTFKVTGGSLPLGLKLDPETGQISGSAISMGSYLATITIQDSYTPPELVTGQLTIQVVPPPLSIAAASVPSRLLLNRPFSGRVVVLGGVPPYSFTLQSGSLPPGLSSIDPSTGQFNGTPTSVGNYFFTVRATDSNTPVATIGTGLLLSVVTPLGRNDTAATASLNTNSVGSNLVFYGSISPYDDPATTPSPGDNDFYKLTSFSGATVHLETSGNGPLDTVLQVVDGNGNELTTCRQPGDTSTDFSSPCINDDIPNTGGTNSALDFKVPGSPGTPTTFYVRVLDWRGDARPDMTYTLTVYGLVRPMTIQTTWLAGAARGLPYSQILAAANWTGTLSWSVGSGSLPPGLTLNSSGTISGAATANGTYSFTLVATDGSAPPQIATAPETIEVVDPIQITSPAKLPDACLNQPYTFAMQTSGGLPPFFWSFSSMSWLAFLNLNYATGVFSGTPTATGTFTGDAVVTDRTQAAASQQITVTINTCP